MDVNGSKWAIPGHIERGLAMATTEGHIEKGRDNSLSDAEAYLGAGATQLRGEQFDGDAHQIPTKSFHINDFGLPGPPLTGKERTFSSISLPWIL